MSRRAPLPIPPALFGLGYSIEDQLYTITSAAGITYKFPFDIMNDLKRRYKNYESLEAWYNDFSKEDRKRIIRENLPASPGDDYFWPDE